MSGVPCSGTSRTDLRKKRSQSTTKQPVQRTGTTNRGSNLPLAVPKTGTTKKGSNPHLVVPKTGTTRKGSNRHLAVPKTGRHNKCTPSTSHQSTPANKSPAEANIQTGLQQRISVTKLPYPENGLKLQTKRAVPSTRNNLDNAVYTSTSIVTIHPGENPPSSEEIAYEEFPELYFKTDDSDLAELDYLMPLLQQEIHLSEFLKLSSPYTRDNGELLFQVANEEINGFQSMIKSTVDDQVMQEGANLVNKNTDTVQKYKEMTNNIKKQTSEVNGALKMLVPDFDWIKYEGNPHYMQDYFFSLYLKKVIPKMLGREEKDEVKELDCLKTLHKINCIEDDLKKIQDQEDDMRNTLSQLRNEKAEHQMQGTAEIGYLQEKNKVLQEFIKELHEVLRRCQTEKLLLMSVAGMPESDMLMDINESEIELVDYDL